MSEDELRKRHVASTTADAIADVYAALEKLGRETHAVALMCSSVLKEVAAVRSGDIAMTMHQRLRLLSHVLIWSVIIGAFWWRLEWVAGTVPEFRDTTRIELTNAMSKMSSELIAVDHKAAAQREKNAIAISDIYAKLTELDRRVTRIEGRFEGLPRPQPDPGKSSFRPHLGPPVDTKRLIVYER